MRRRLFAGEREIRSLGRLTVSTHRVLLHRAGRWGAGTAAVLLAHVEATRFTRPRWGSPRLEVHAGRARFVLHHPDAYALRNLADLIDGLASAVHGDPDAAFSLIWRGAFEQAFAEVDGCA